MPGYRGIAFVYEVPPVRGTKGETVKRTLSLAFGICMVAGLAFANFASGQTQYPYPPECKQPVQNIIVGTEGNDLRDGTPLNDLMFGFGGDDIYGGNAGA